MVPAGAIDFSRVKFPPLPGTQQEGDALKAMMPRAIWWSGADATEAAVKQVAAPTVLHIATHGFFLEDLALGSASYKRGIHVGGSQLTSTRLENPLLRSGLALAGANLHKAGDDDGVLTALEVAGLDLWGTKLVVLSACETGVGEVRSGDGVYGLRRALVLAGSESQVLSLWKVDDDATRDYAGSGGTDLQCLGVQGVLNALAVPPAPAFSSPCTAALGCVYDNDGMARVRCTSPATTAPTTPTISPAKSVSGRRSTVPTGSWSMQPAVRRRRRWRRFGPIPTCSPIRASSRS